jgi:hypothetical protein
MATLRLFALLVLLVAVLAPVASTAVAAPVNECGNFDGSRFTFEDLQGAGVQNITTRVVGCRTAHRLVRRYYNHYEDYCGNSGRCSIRGWSCLRRSLGVEYADVRCARRSGQVVRFQYGA